MATKDTLFEFEANKLECELKRLEIELKRKSFWVGIKRRD